MAKRKSFEELLNTEFRWPMQGDQPFVVDSNHLENTSIPEDAYTRLVLMTDGYKAAADLMVEKAETDHSMRGTLVFPIIFNYRQFLELSLKFQLDEYGPARGIKPIWNTHNLATLWSEFLVMLEHYGTPDPDEADPVVGEIILEFAKIDPRSYAYRYPVDLRGNPIPIEYSVLHLPTLADVMEGVEGYFMGCHGFICDRL